MQKKCTFDNYRFNEEDTEFESCIFQHSSFANFNFSGYEFTDCTFISCDFSTAGFERLALIKVCFINCKLLGVDFSKCSKFNFSVRFEDCILDYTFFFKNNLKKVVFKKCAIKEANFSECDLTAVVFEGCDLHETRFDRNNLEGCDFRSAFNYKIVPSDNRMKGAMFSLSGIMGLLEHYQIVVEEF